MKYYEAVELTESCFYPWKKLGCIVLRDGYTTNGTRVHFVDAKGYNGEKISNAYVFSVR